MISEDHYLGIGHVFEKVFEFVKENRAFYSVYLSRNSKMQVINVILPEKYQISKAETGRKIGFADAYELSYHETFFMAGLTAMIPAVAGQRMYGKSKRNESDDWQGVRCGKSIF